MKEKPYHQKYLKRRARNFSRGLNASGKLPVRNEAIRKVVAQAVANCERMKAEATMRAFLHVRSL